MKLFKDLATCTHFSMSFNGSQEMIKIDNIFNEFGDVVANVINIETGNLFYIGDDTKIEHTFGS